MRLDVILRCYQRVPKDYSNFPARYIKRQTEFIEWKPPRRPNYNRSIVIRWRYAPYYDRFRSWSAPFQSMNEPGVHHPKIWVEPIERFYFFKGDRVEILRGPDKGKQGLVNYVVKERNWVFVEGLNISRKVRDEVKGVKMVQIEENPLLVPRDVALVDPSDKQPTTIKWKYDEDGNLVRVSDRTGRIIYIPKEAFKTYDYTTKDQYIESAKDTTGTELSKITFKPALKTFEMDIMEEHGIKEDRVPHKLYWF